MKTIVLIMLMIALLVTPVAAVTYSEEYYKLGNYTTYVYEHMNDRDIIGTLDWGKLHFVELRRQTILMEKQNELLEEQNGLMRTQMGMKLKCKVAGNLNGAYCDEYTWVNKNTPIPTGR